MNCSVTDYVSEEEKVCKAKTNKKASIKSANSPRKQEQKKKRPLEKTPMKSPFKTPIKVPFRSSLYKASPAYKRRKAVKAALFDDNGKPESLKEIGNSQNEIVLSNHSDITFLPDEFRELSEGTVSGDVFRILV